jgi:hypothetical protein
MGRPERFSSIAYNSAIESELCFRHGSVVSKGSKVIFTGRNNTRTQSAYINSMALCEHAELNVARQLINCIIRKKNKNRHNDLGKYIIWVVRVNPSSISDSVNMGLRESNPCQDCIDKLMRLGFKRIGYSIANGDMVVNKLIDIDGSGIVTSSQKFFTNNVKNFR